MRRSLPRLQTVRGIRIEDSTNLTITGWLEYTGRLEPPVGGEQEAHVVITGQSSGIRFGEVEDIEAGAGAVLWAGAVE